MTGSASILAYFSLSSFSSAFIAGVLISVLFAGASERPGRRPESNAWAASDTVGAPRRSRGSDERAYGCSSVSYFQAVDHTVQADLDHSETSCIASETCFIVRPRADNICSLYFFRYFGRLSMQELEQRSVFQ